MNANTIRLMHYQKDTGLIKSGAKAPSNYFDFAFDDSSPEEIKKYSIDEKEQALADLAKYTSTCEVMEGFAGSYYSVNAYALEFYEEDEDGDYIDGSDFEPASEEDKEA